LLSRYSYSLFHCNPLTALVQLRAEGRAEVAAGAAAAIEDAEVHARAAVQEAEELHAKLCAYELTA
jgi:hypothetical protein